jgi:uncharacterized protein (DUF885 family)
MMRFWIGLLLPAVVFFPTVLRAADEDEVLASFFRSYLHEMFRAEPVAATHLGDHAYDDRLDDLSAEARAANLGRRRRALEDLPKRVHFEKLSRDGQIDFEIFRNDLARAIWLNETFKPFEDDPRTYGDYLTESVYLLLSQSSLPLKTNLENALARMMKIPKIAEIARATIGNPPRVKTETAIRQTKGAIDFYENDLFVLAGKPKGDGRLGEAAKTVVSALREHLRFLESNVLPRSTDDWRIGKERFDKKLELELDTGLSADELVAEAKAEAERVETEMATVARLLWAQTFPGKAVLPDDPMGRREMIRRVLGAIAADHGMPETLVADAKATVAEIKDFIAAQKILSLPNPDRCRVLEMPEFKRGNSVAYLDSAPPLDPEAHSEYAISPPPSDWNPRQVASYLQEYNRAMLKVLTIHEAYPGHYVQLEYSNRCPSLVRKVLSSGAMVEGWAVYTERMMLDQGYGGDLKLRLQQLKFYLRAVVNAILDHEMHAGNMSDAEAMELLVGRAFQTEGEALGKIIRAKQTSCQLSTYFAGRTAWYRLRQAIQREQGERFDLARFHEAALSHGSVPVKYLPELVRRTLQGEPAAATQ